MKKRIRLCALLLLCAVWLMQALAESASFEPTVRLAEKDGTGEAAFLLEARDSSCPMPEGSNALRAELRMNGAGEAGFGKIRCGAPGIYEYTVRQIPGSRPNVQYDNTVYHLRVTAFVTESNALALNVAINGDTDDKADALSFRNVFPVEHKKESSVPYAKTGVEDHWMLYFVGCIALICATFFVIRVLLCGGKDE